MALEGRFQVETFPTAMSALEAIAIRQPDLLISDIRMPVMNGLDLVRNVSARYPELPIMMLTGYGSLSTAQAAMRLGARDYFTKPFDLDSFRARVETLTQFGREAKARSGDLNPLEEQRRLFEEKVNSLEVQECISQSSAEFLHDLRSPLTMILYYLDRLRETMPESPGDFTGRKSAVDDEPAMLLTHIEQAVKRCSELADMWQDLNIPIEKTIGPVELKHAMNRCLSILSPIARARGVTLHVDPIPDIKVTLSIPHFQRVLHNIFTNALHAVREEVRPLVRISCNVLSDVLEIHICDNGCGVTEAQLEGIFQPYNSVRLNEGHGTGLGLPISRKIIEALDGSLQIFSENNRGARALIRLPLNARPLNRPPASPMEETCSREDVANFVRSKMPKQA